MKKQFIIVSAILLIIIIKSCTLSKVQPEITQDELYNHIKFLASDSLKGRYPGTPEDKVAAKYIASQFKNSGLELLYNDGLQNFEINTKIKLGENNFLSINNKKIKINEDFIPISFSNNSEINSEVIFVGYGFKFKDADILWNDYTNIDIKDKWVLVLMGKPNTLDKSIPFDKYSSLRSKATIAKDLGASGVIFVSGEQFDIDDELIILEKPEGNINIPVIQVKRTVANILLANSNKTIHDLEVDINDNNKSNSFNTNVKLKCKTDLISDNILTYNVVARLKSTKQSNNYIVIGAHYDHLGFGGVGSGSRAPNDHRIHYGADDNASGVSSVIEIAEKLASVKDSLNTNFLFVAFGAEEKGLLGSKYFTNNLPINDSLITAMINIDMIGRMKQDSSLQIGGVGTSIEGESLLQEMNSQYHFKFGLSYEGYGPSDHSSFYSKDIPVFFFSTGAHVDYHTPGDSLGSINFGGLEFVAKYIYDFAYDLSSQNKLLTFQEAGPKISNKPGRQNFKVTLGIMPDFSNVEKRGLRADIVIKDKPAYKAGMKNGDIIIAIDGYPVGDIYEYMERLSKLKAEQIITLEVIRNEQKEVLIVQL